MLTMLPSGLLGLVLASLIAAYMSTISTQLNWGSSYIVYDFYKQQINPNASEKKLVAVGRISTIVLMLFSAVLALLLQNALQLFNLLLVFGAGTGLIFILRWFWWRINAWSEITAMFASGIVSLSLKLTPLGNFLFNPADGVFDDYMEYPLVVLVTTFIWLFATFVTKPESKNVLRDFYKKIQPGGPGWKKVIEESELQGINIVGTKEKWDVPSGILCMLFGSISVYSILFGIGYILYSQTTTGIMFMIISVISVFAIMKFWKRLSTEG